jgi:pimeloyl-ACP methyl ester carboxylesterase
MPVISHDDLDIHYVVHGPPDLSGHGPPVVLIHGLFFSTHMFDRLATRLPERNVVAIDVRGHGRSGRPKLGHRYGWGRLATDVVAVLDDLRIERVVLGGLSLGAGVALTVARQQSERIAGLMLEMPVLRVSEPFARVVFGLLATGLRVSSPVLGPIGYAARVVPRPTRPPELAMLTDLLTLRPLSAAALIEGLQASKLPDHDAAFLATLDMPALVIGHHWDLVHRFEDAQILAARLPDAELVEVHTLVDFRVRPDAYARAVGRLLGRVDEREAGVTSMARWDSRTGRGQNARRGARPNPRTRTARS